MWYGQHITEDKTLIYFYIYGMLHVIMLFLAYLLEGAWVYV